MLRPLTGRDAERAVLAGLMETDPVGGPVLVMLGEAGVGKSVMAAEAGARARSLGWHVLSATGRQSETNLAFSALHELLRPVLAATTDLPERQRQALGGALGTAPEAQGADRFLVGIAALTLLSEVSERAPLFLIVEDVHWLDHSSLGVVSFVGHRLAGEPVAVLMTGRESELPRGFDRSFAELHLPPLAPPDANRLLETLDRPPRGRARAQILAQAAGNPLALIELSKVMADDPDAARRWVAEPIPLTDRLSAVMATQSAALPKPTQAALLYAAVADGSDLLSHGTHLPGFDVEALVPAEQAGLVRVGQDGLQFSHPLVRSAVYHAAPFARRSAAHRQVADLLLDQPDRRAWHLAAATIGRDEAVAALLETTATEAQRRDGAFAAATAMERSAELSPDREDQARRFVDAASMALSTGQADWVQDLGSRALAATTDPELQVAARRAMGWALVWSTQQAAAVSLLLSVVAEASSRDLLLLAWDALGHAATAANYLGTPDGYQSVRRALEPLERQTQGEMNAAQRADVDDRRLWIVASTDRFASRSEVFPHLRRTASLSMEVAGAAFALDESRRAVDLYRDAVARLNAPGVRGASGGALLAFSLGLYDIGEWDEALVVAAEADELADAYRMGIIGAFANWTMSMVNARRGNLEASRAHADKAMSLLDPEQNRTVVTAVRHARGVAAIGAGSFVVAFDQLSQLFAADGTPTHIHRSYLGIADLATAAVRGERLGEGRELLGRVRAAFQGTPSPRLERLFSLAQAVLAEPDEAEAHFERALHDPGASQWPFERAQAQLAYAEWLRRRRRINEAKPVLVSALEAFQQLRARPSTRRAETELRACGVVMATAPDALADLTPQQRQIVRLASEGLTNREIGDRLFLSPHTVTSHLYRCYPKLGVTARHQLRDIVALADKAQGERSPSGN